MSSHYVVKIPRYSRNLKSYRIQCRNDFCFTKGDNPVPRLIATAPIERKYPPIYISTSVQRVLEEHNALNVPTLLAKSDT